MNTFLNKAYLLYIKEYIIFSKNKGIKDKHPAIEEFLLDKYNRGQSPQTINLIENIIEATDNAKYRLMISLGYGCGLRVS